MDKDSAIIIIVGLGITFGFLGFLAYLIAQGKQQIQPPTAVTSFVPIQPQEKQKETVVITDEVRPSKPHITNHILNNANQWYEISIPPEIRTWSMNARGEYDLLYSFEPSHATYRTLFSGTFLDSDTEPRRITPTAMYVMSQTAGAVVEMTFFR